MKVLSAAPQVKSRPYTLNGDWVAPPPWSWSGEGKHLLPLPGVDPDITNIQVVIWAVTRLHPIGFHSCEDDIKMDVK
jgi:hypothetical protein